ncbi:hypothetical protein ACH4UM_20810 [Streptomyces sp. NPDC020801]|uniref:hypothetical protein n=1 Tax=Streptomyces sp. NPDC020801 TaxID=3365093 RepID=UPI0037A023E0
MAVASFMLGIFFIAAAAPFIVKPDERLSWEPEAKYDTEALEAVRYTQRQDEWMLDQYEKRKTRAIVCGVISTLLGLAFLLLTTDRTWGVYATVAALVIAAVGVVCFFVSAPGWLFPGLANFPDPPESLPPLSTEERAMIGFEEGETRPNRLRRLFGK